MAVGLSIVALLSAVYVVSNLDRSSYYNHFVWQAQAFLEGHAQIRFPVAAGPDGPGNELFQDVIPTLGPAGQATGYAMIPFPPLPAIILMPFVAVWGLATNAQIIATGIGALDVGIAYWMLGRLPVGRRARVASTVFLGLGTVLWYAAELGTTWFLAHVVAVGLTLLAIGVALSSDTEAALDFAALDGAETADASSAAVEAQQGVAAQRGLAAWPRTLTFDRRQLLAGFLFGLACTARLTIVFGAPFFMLVGGGGNRARRGLSAFFGMAIPIGALLGYTYVTTGHLMSPVYDALYNLETLGYPDLNYHQAWAVEDVRYLVQNLQLFLTGPPSIMPPCDPGAVRGLFDGACPIVAPQSVGMGLFLTSPGWLIAGPALLRAWQNRLVAGAAIAIVTIAVVDLMHFSQGWVQFGYRFSNDYAPFGLLLVALSLDKGGRTWTIGRVLIAVSIAVNFWGVLWGHLLGW